MRIKPKTEVVELIFCKNFIPTIFLNEHTIFFSGLTDFSSETSDVADLPLEDLGVEKSLEEWVSICLTTGLLTSLGAFILSGISCCFTGCCSFVVEWGWLISILILSLEFLTYINF